MKYARKYWYSFLLGPFFMVLEASGEFILPYINANIINIGAARGDIPYIIQNGLYMVLIAIGMLVTGVLGANFAIRGASRLACGLRQETFSKIQTFSFNNIDSFSTGSLITRLTNDITQIQNFTQTLLRGVFRSPVMLIGAVIMSFTLNPSLAKVILLIVPFLALAIGLIIMTTAPRYRTMQEKLDRVNTGIEEALTNEKVIKSFAREEFEKEKFAVTNQELVDKSIRALKVMQLMMPVSTFAINLATILVVWIAGRQVMVGSMEVGTLTAFITYLSQILNSLNMVAMIVLSGTRAAASSHRIGEVLDAEVDLSDENAREKDLEVENPEISFSHVSFRYFKDRPAKILDDITLSIKPGQMVGLIGSTGSGKTTLVSLIPRLYDADEGTVSVGGHDVRDLSLFHLREVVSVVLQKNTLFSGTIAENLRWGSENATDEEVREAAVLAEADSFISSFPEGYQTDLSQGGLNLSGGQKQRLCIARALLKKPKILVLDDSTSALDTTTDARIRRSFREKLPGVTKIIIAQRINSIKDADVIFVLDNGKLVGQGTHGTLLASCRAYQEIYYSQNEKEETDVDTL